MSARTPRVCLIHTSNALIVPLTEVFQDILPQAELVHIMDDALLKDVRMAGHVTQGVTRRMVLYVMGAEAAGADIILNCCSSVSETMDVARQVVSTPIVKIDEPMAEEATRRGGRIGVLATVPTTLAPTCRLVERMASAGGKTLTIRQQVCEGAFDVLMAGDARRHDEMVLEGIINLAKESNVVVLAQGSMARLVPQLDADVAACVLSSPRGGALRVREVLEKAGKI
ncbi:MAG: aspartate/glutamate racemase family protein [Bacteroidetes bacterium]|nr:aspartate/glutamate racemase family protein [Bacteroidota bacterium]MCL5026916.1 aspartate/glutamate racemase family protein [Chloroflexota bacterium]